MTRPARTASFGAVLALILAVVAVPSPVGALAGTVRHYAGETSAGDRFRISTRTSDNGVVTLNGITVDAVATCDDGTSFAFSHGLRLGAGGPVIVGGQVDLEEIFFSEAFLLSGQLAGPTGSGTVTHVFATLDALEQPQVCTTGELTWDVSQVTDAAGARPARIVTTTVVDGARLTARTGSPDADAAARDIRLRSYRGRMSSRDQLFVITAKHPGGVALIELGFGWNLACDDGTSVGIGFFILFAGEPLDPARLDYDLPAAGGGFALHIHGRLGVHAGSGTTSTTMAALTADLQAQACRTGDLTWRAWRTDPGARPALSVGSRTG